MLLIGDYKCIPSIRVSQYISAGEISVYNLSSYITDCVQITNLLPRGVDCSSEENFDMSYFDYIFSNDIVFMSFMTIINGLYNSNIVYLIINHNEFNDKVTESLVEIIKQRYGIIAYFINDPEDYNSLFINRHDNDFSIPGLTNLDLDKNRMIGILAMQNMLPEEDYD